MAIYTFKEAIERSNPTQTVGETSMQPDNREATGSSLLDRLSARFNKTVDNTVPVITGEATPKELVANALSTGANVLGGVTDIAQTAIKGIVDTIAPDSVKQGAEAAIRDIASSLDIKSVIDKYSNFKKENPVAGELVDNVFDIGNFILTFTGVPKISASGANTLSKIPNLVESGANAVVDSKVGQTIANTASKVSGAVDTAIDTTKNLATGVEDIAKLSYEGASRIPNRVSTNLADVKATAKSIEELPTAVAKNATRDGVDIFDTKQLYSIPEELKPSVKPLIKAIKEFDATGGNSIDPIEIVGKPIVQNIKGLNKKLSTVGEKLGVVAKNLPNVKKSEILPNIVEALQRVPGLEGLTVSEKGLLNFENTTLNLKANAGARKALQETFTAAIKDGTGLQKHLTRQEIFEILGGKKKSLANITATEDKAYQAIRDGLSTVLESKDSAYKVLSNQYREIVQPLNDIKKLIKYSRETDGDILNMSAGLLARRLTSNAGSQSAIRDVLRKLDRVVKGGKLAAKTETLQEVYNLLDKYYNITKKTSLQGVMTTGIDKADSFKDIASQAVGGMVGKTEAVRRKAIEDILKEVFN